MTSDKGQTKKIKRKFSSYGPVDTDLHYYVPRQALVDEAILKLMGENPAKGGHYITVWAPRQRGKTWVLFEAISAIENNPKYKTFDIIYLPLEHLKLTTNVNEIAQDIAKQIINRLDLPALTITGIKDIYDIFTANVLNKPLILILDEFDALVPEGINAIDDKNRTKLESIYTDPKWGIKVIPAFIVTGI